MRGPARSVCLTSSFPTFNPDAIFYRSSTGSDETSRHGEVCDGITSNGNESVCGKLISADQQRYIIQPEGTSRNTTVAFDDVTNVYVLDDC